MNPPFFSIIIPTYNRRFLLPKTLESVLEQTDPDWECLVVDDGSEDNTADFVRSLTEKRLRYFYQDNQGPAAARNTGLREARGAWIAFLDSDDWWEPNKLERFSGAIKQYPDIRIFHSEEIWFKNGRRHNPKRKHQKPDGRVFTQALPLCCISISTAVLHREVFDTVGLFDVSLPVCEDYDFWLRATHRYEVKLIPEYLTLKDGGRDDQLSLKTWGMDRFRIQALIKQLASGELSPQEQQLTAQILKEKCTIFAQGAQKRGKKEEASHYLQLMEKWV